MTGEQFRDWLEAANFSVWEAAKVLGVSRVDIEWYRERGGPRMLGLACQAILEGLYGGTPDPARIVEVVRRHEAGETFKAIADSLGLHQVRVAQIYHKAKERAREVRDARITSKFDLGVVRAAPVGHKAQEPDWSPTQKRLATFQARWSRDPWEFCVVVGRTAEGHTIAQKIRQTGSLSKPDRVRCSAWRWLEPGERPDLEAKFLTEDA